MQDGWVKLHRKSLESAVWQNEKLWRFWTWCIMKASYKPHNHMVGFQEVSLEPGQFVFGRKSASDETGLSERSIRTCVNALKTGGMVVLKTTSKYSVITICNWGTYQSPENTNDQQATNKRPASDQQTTTNKKEKNSKKETTTTGVSDFEMQFDPTYKKIINIWTQARKKVNMPTVQDKNTRDGAGEIAAMIGENQIELKDVEHAMNNLMADSDKREKYGLRGLAANLSSFMGKAKSTNSAPGAGKKRFTGKCAECGKAVEIERAISSRETFIDCPVCKSNVDLVWNMPNNAQS